MIGIRMLYRISLVVVTGDLRGPQTPGLIVRYQLSRLFHLRLRFKTMFQLFLSVYTSSCYQQNYRATNDDCTNDDEERCAHATGGRKDCAGVVDYGNFAIVS